MEMDKVCYADLMVKASRAGDMKKAQAVLDQELNYYAAQLMALFSSTYVGDWALILAALEMARPALYDKMPEPMRLLEQVLLRNCSATTVAIPVKRGE